ncbi:MAG: ligase-associated DNA damage response endonuclease PdeM [Planctomycetota bacterium]
MTDQTIHLAGETLEAMPERTLWWPRTRTLALADLHLGKDEGLRAAGAAVPTGPMAADLDRLSAAIDRTNPDRVIIVGDLIHGRLGLKDHVIDSVAAWRAGHGCGFILVVGNHDRNARGNKLPAALDAWGMETADPELTIGPICFVHDPADATGPSVTGHVHPSIGVGRGARVPAFVRTGEVIVLPAFSAFTSGAPIDPRAADEVVCCCEGEAVRLTPPRSPAR